MTLVARLRSIAGDEHVITQEHQLRTYESDGLLQYKASPRAVVLPGSAEEVQQVVAACHEARSPGSHAAPARASAAARCPSRRASSSRCRGCGASST